MNLLKFLCQLILLLLLFLALFHFYLLHSLLLLSHHAELCILFLQVGLGLVKLLYHVLLKFVKDTILFILNLEIVKKSLLCFVVTTEEKRNTYKKALFEELVIVHLSYMFAEELDCTNFNHCILFSYNFRLVLNIIIGVPIGCRCHKVSIFDFY